MNPRLARIVAWLRAGYPTGMPESDYMPIVALLRRRLTDDEVRLVANHLQEEQVVPDKVDIGVGVTKVTQELPSESDMSRVAERLRSTGWPIESWNDTTRTFDGWGA